MKYGKIFLAFALLVALAHDAKAQFPFYDIELQPVCMDSAGVQTTLTSAQFYVLGRNGFDVWQQFYFQEDGTKVVPGVGVTIYDAPCWEVITQDTAQVLSFESSIPVSAYTIPADTYDVVSIVNLGYDTHTVTVGNAQVFRMLPGERYIFRSTYDEYSRKVLRNPTIVLAVGTVLNNLRVYAEAK